MKWFFAFNEDYKEITDIFFSTIKDQCDLIPVEISNFKKKWRMAGGREGDEMRKNLLEYAMSKTEKDEVFIVCDTDIKFYKPVEEVVLEEIENNDFIIQREARVKFCNMGFMAMRNNDNVRNFWKNVYEISISNNSWDQKTLNKIIYNKQNNLKWKRFSEKIWNWSMGKSRVEFNDKTCLHHANCAITKENKIKQFQYVEDCFLNNKSIDFKKRWIGKNAGI